MLSSALLLSVIITAGSADVVLPSAPGAVEEYAAEELRHHLGKAFGCEIPLVREDGLAASKASFHFHVGRTKAAAEAGLTDRPPAEEERILKSVPDGLVLLGGDGPTTRQDLLKLKGFAVCGTLFAVCDFLEHELGVKWIWPGELGEVVPRRTELELGEIDRRGREPLIMRSWSIFDPTAEKDRVGFARGANREKYFRDLRRFLLRHRIVQPHPIPMGHAFRHYWKKHGATHPEYFNLLPNGRREPLDWDQKVTMCVSQPALWKQVVDDSLARFERTRNERYLLLPWINCCENDTAAICTCEACRAWDGPDPRFALNPYWNGSLKKEFSSADGAKRMKDFAHAEFGIMCDTRWCFSRQPPEEMNPASVSDRYVRFYNAVLAEARTRNLGDDLRVVGYAYVNYLEAPLEAKVDPGVVIDFVPRSLFPYDKGESEYFRRHWAGWRAAGTRELIYRPNYTYAGGNYPMDFARLALDDFAFAATNGMIGCHFDALLGSFSSHAMSSYAFNRAMREPTRGYAKAREDMLSAFGSAAAAVNRYFDAIEAHTMSWTYEECRSLSRANRMGRWTGGSFTTPAAVLGEYFTEDDLAKFDGLLDDAARATGNDALVLRRIDFLRAGLRDTRLTRACRLAQRAHLASPDDPNAKAAFESAFGRLTAYRASVEANNVCNYAHLALWERDMLKWPHVKTGK